MCRVYQTVLRLSAVQSDDLIIRGVADKNIFHKNITVLIMLMKKQTHQQFEIMLFCLLL